MGEPVDPGDDLAVTRGIVRTLEFRAFDPATDAHAEAVSCRGFRGPKRVEATAAGDGGAAVVTRADWTLIELPTRPVLRSLVVDPESAEEWAVDSVEEHEPADGVWDLAATLTT